MKWLGSAALAVFVIGSCSPKANDSLVTDTPSAAAPATQPAAAPTPAPAPSIEGLPAGDYKLDPLHSTLVFSASHLGFSNYVMQFGKFDANLKLDPANPATATLTATVDPTSLQIPSPPAGFLDELKGKSWMDTAAFPQITFKSTSVKVTGPNFADVTGDLTLHGVTKPVTLEITFNGGYPGFIQDPNARIGFSGRGTFKRSDFGIAYGIPEPGSNMGVSDEVSVRIETEFNGPPLKDPPPATPPAN
jgi:polyisoprenoid-binding protein YceI